MNRKSTVDQFVEAIAGHVTQGNNGTMVLMGQNEGWGKAIIEDGELVSIIYGIYRGKDALQQISQQPKIRFMFRPDKKDESSGPGKKAFANAGSARMSNDEFFAFFDFDYTFFQFGDDPEATPVSTVDNISTATRKKILVIDDSKIARKMAVRILNDNGYAVVQARDGFDALGKLELENPDLIMLDLIMPGIDGYKVVDLLKKNRKYQNLPIILVTSKDSLMDKLKGKMSSTDAYITKPYKDKELIKVIEGLLSK